MSARSATTGPGRPPLSSATTPCLRDAGLRLEPEALEPLDDVLGGLDFAVRQLRVLMKVAPPRQTDPARPRRASLSISAARDCAARGRNEQRSRAEQTGRQKQNSMATVDDRRDVADAHTGRDYIRGDILVAVYESAVTDSAGKGAR